MSSFVRYLHPLPAARRSYSSFFSSKPGGGRYFNSARPTKTVVTSSAAKKGITKEGGNAATNTVKDAEDRLQQAEGNGESGSRRSLSLASCSEASSSRAASSSPSRPTNSHPPITDTNNSSQPAAPAHPVIDSKNFKLHQFFSIHRPLLLLSDPTAILRSVPPGSSLHPELQLQQATTHTQLEWPHTIAPDTLEAMNADADTARQLNRALTLSRAGSAAVWESTLRRLGLDVEQQPDRVGLQAQMDKEWQDVMLDSVKRKRRKKMKKHKRKKRRRLSRAERQRQRAA